MRLKNITTWSNMLIAAFVLFILNSCTKDSVTQTQTYTYSITTAVYKTRAEFVASINGNSTEPVKTAGKLYIKDQFIFLNEVDKGIHIIDNSDATRPTQVAFLNIPGNRDIAVRGNILYADTYTDLLSIDISNPKKAVVTKSIPGFFQSRLYIYSRDTNQIIVGITKKDTTVNITTNYSNCPNCAYALSNTADAAKNLPATNGTSGSMASIVLMNNYLYALREAHTIGIVNLSSPAQPHHDTTFNAGYDLQTMFPFEGKLFLGSMSGMFMYDVSNPVKPVKLGQFAHGRACDPVVTDGSYAYVTLHAGTTCGGAANELNVIDIKDLMNPLLVKTYPLTKPTGLCKDGNLLFVCDDASGVRIYDATSSANLKQLNKIDITGAYDIIAGDHHAMVVTSNGLYQYTYNNTGSLTQLSSFSLKN